MNGLEDKRHGQLAIRERNHRLLLHLDFFPRETCHLLSGSLGEDAIMGNIIRTRR